jgi:hypothetical protein
MRMSSSDAFDEWSNTVMDHHFGDRNALTRLELIMKSQSDRLMKDLDYAFQAGWYAALRNLVTGDI